MVTINDLLAQITLLEAQLQHLKEDIPEEKILVLNNKGEKRLLKILKFGIEEMRYEIDRIEQFLSDLSSRGAALITTSGLISLLPFFQNANDFFRYYIIYIFPLLAVGIFSYIFAQRRSYVYKTIFTSPNFQMSDELQVIKSYSKATEDIWNSVYKSYQRSSIWHRISAIGIFCFLLSYVLNFYSYCFDALPTPQLALAQMILFVALGILEYYRKSKLQSFLKEYKKDITQQFSEGGVGAVQLPPDAFNK